jgi:hypothetical protein
LVQHAPASRSQYLGVSCVARQIKATKGINYLHGLIKRAARTLICWNCAQALARPGVIRHAREEVKVGTIASSAEQVKFTLAALWPIGG